jgi:hypothetical protein
MGAAGSGGEPAAREPGLGTGRGGDVTGIANSRFLVSQRDDAVAIVGRGSPSETQRFGSVCDCRFTKR